jgi:general secretion pathway protein I
MNNSYRKAPNARNAIAQSEEVYSIARRISRVKGRSGSLPSAGRAGEGGRSCARVHRSLTLPIEREGTRRLRGASRSAFSLLEVILALAILAGSLAALGEVMRMAGQAARLTESETQAQILAASLMDELASGARQLTAVSQSTLDSSSNPPWTYSIALEDTGYQQMVAVRVTIEQQLDSRLQPARFELVRWMPNPNYIPPETEDESKSSSSSSTSGQSSSSSGTNGGTGGSR